MVFRIIEEPVEACFEGKLSFHFTVVGGSPCQRRAMFYRSRNTRLRGVPMAYDPSANEKKLFRMAILESLRGFGVEQFRNCERTKRNGVRLEVVFLECRPKSHLNTRGELRPNLDYLYPSKKDADNQLKFVMDALSGVFYDNDVWVRRATAEKEFFSVPTGVHVKEEDKVDRVKICVGMY